jgi:uncharacterized protein (TIGR02302 family)
MSDLAQHMIDRKITQQRLSLLWQDIWAASQLALCVLALSFAVIASGILQFLPKFAQIGVLGLLAVSFIYALGRFASVDMVSRFRAMRVLEDAASLEHRGLSSHHDQLVAENPDPLVVELWEEHQRRKLAGLSSLPVSWPKSLWRQFDPRALRVPVALAALVAFLLGPGDVISNAQNALNREPQASGQPLTLDAWLKPPAYTGKAPLLLSSVAITEKIAKGEELRVAENALLTLRVQGAAHPRLAFYALGSDTELKEISAKVTDSEAGFVSEAKLQRPMTVKVFDGNVELAAWPISLIPDQPPSVNFIDVPSPAKQGATKVDWQVADDYGVKSLTAEISLADQQETGVGFESNGVFLYDAPKFKMSLRKAGAKAEKGSTTQDLASHAWAGLYVEMVLTATDAAGHATSSPSKRFKLPERNFSKFLARALIEQRKKLILVPDETPNVANMLDIFLIYPYAIADHSGLILNLAAIKASLAQAGDTDTVVAAVEHLWPLIVAIEDGEMADVRAELKALKQQLEQALRDGAPKEKIAELMDKMRKAMNKLMSQLDKEAEKQKADGEKQRGGKSVTKKDLQDMLDKLEQLSKNGDKAGAEKLLSELDDMLQNMKPGGQSAGGEGDGMLQQQMDELSDLMRRQQKLMDETQRLGQNGKEQPSDGDKLGEQQGKLSQRLDRLGKGTGESFGEAPKGMKDAEGGLKQGDKQGALKGQGQAMEGMREGAKKLGEKLAQQKQDGSKGEAGKSGGNENDDPLGRPRATRNPGDGPDKDMVPSELAMQRAREILEKLRNRSNDDNLSDTERRYIERLLEGLY